MLVSFGDRVGGGDGDGVGFRVGFKLILNEDKVGLDSEAKLVVEAVPFILYRAH